MEGATIEGYERYHERERLFKKFGYDIEWERGFIVEKAQPLIGEVLEIGTGKGYFTITLAKRGHRFTSVDISEEEQEFVKGNLQHLGLEKQVDFIIEDAEDLSFADSSFDVAFSINLIHHLTDPIESVNELLRVVSGKGKIILSDFNKEGLNVVGKIHKSEGRVHPVGKILLPDVEKYVSDKKYRIEKYQSQFQDVLIVHNRGTEAT